MWIWGQNLKGELGFGDNSERKSPTPILQLNNKSITYVTASEYFSCAIGQINLNIKE